MNFSHPLWPLQLLKLLVVVESGSGGNIQRKSMIVTPVTRIIIMETGS